MRTETRTSPLVNSGRLPQLAVFVLIAVLGTAWDLWSKWFVFDWLGPHGQDVDHIWLWGAVRFRFRTTFNFGALWGMGQNMTWLFASLSIVAAIAICGWMFLRRQAVGWWITICLGLILGGTLGNLYDRLGLHGWRADGGRPVHAVRDFLDFQLRGPWGEFDWAIFNFADTYLVVGAILLMIYSMKTDVSEAPLTPLAEVRQ